jgi:hypothetical protein
MTRIKKFHVSLIVEHCVRVWNIYALGWEKAGEEASNSGKELDIWVVR